MGWNRSKRKELPHLINGLVMESPKNAMLSTSKEPFFEASEQSPWQLAYPLYWISDRYGKSSFLIGKSSIIINLWFFFHSKLLVYWWLWRNVDVKSSSSECQLHNPQVVARLRGKSVLKFGIAQNRSSDSRNLGFFPWKLRKILGNIKHRIFFSGFLSENCRLWTWRIQRVPTPARARAGRMCLAQGRGVHGSWWKLLGKRREWMGEWMGCWESHEYIYIYHYLWNGSATFPIWSTGRWYIDLFFARLGLR